MVFGTVQEARDARAARIKKMLDQSTETQKRFERMRALNAPLALGPEDVAGTVEAVHAIMAGAPPQLDPKTK